MHLIGQRIHVLAKTVRGWHGDMSITTAKESEQQPFEIIAL